MDNADAVSGAQGFENVGRVAQRLRDCEGTLRAQELAEGGSVNELHHKESLSGDHALIEDGNDARVNNAGCGACLTAEACDEILGVRQVWVHDLQSDGAVQALVLGDVHGCHAAARQTARDSVSFVDQEPDQRVGLVECLFVAHLVDSMRVFAKIWEV